MSNNFPDKLKGLRKDKKLSQQYLADKLEVSRATIGHWEIGRSEPNMKELVKVSNFFGCTLDYLIDPNIPKDHILYKNGITNEEYKEMIEEIKDRKCENERN